jgi:DNA-binding NtrC family response regulator
MTPAMKRASVEGTPESSTQQKDSVLIVDDTPTNLNVLVDLFIDRGFEVFIATDGESALEQLEHARPHVILLDVMMPGMDGFETCARLKENEDLAGIPIIFMTALSDVSDKIRAFEAGAVDYVTKPIQHQEVLARVATQIALRHLHEELRTANEDLERRVDERTAELSKALAEVERLKEQLEAENSYLKEEIRQEHDFEAIIGHSDALAGALQKVSRVAKTDATVLLLGESGTGKELFARAVHSRSSRSDRPLVKVNCAALPDNLIESELFGHEKGAFTGADAARPGRFRLADGGTIFLDELGELPLELQAKLLRVLQEGELEPLGGSKTIRVDVRVIAATNRDLEEAVSKGRFREDLYYRLNVFPIAIPSLRERSDDIPDLVHHFVAKHASKLGSEVKTVSKSVMSTLQKHPWPGNVRELEHTIERALIMSTGTTLELHDWRPDDGPVPAAAGLATLEEAERAHILKALEMTGGKVSGPQGAAQLLDINPKTLASRIKKLGLRRRVDFG